MTGAIPGFRSAFERSLEIRDQYRRVIGNCEGFLLRSVVGSRVFKCTSCGRVFVVSETPERCYGCFSRAIVEVDDVVEEVRGYCWRLYGDYLAFSELLVEVSRVLCERYMCSAYDTPSLHVHGASTSFSMDLRKATGRSIILINVYELSMDTLKVLDEIVGVCITRSRELVKAGITHVVIVTSYKWVRVGYEILLAEGFIDTVFHREVLARLGLETLSLEGNIAKIIDLKTGGVTGS